MPTPPLKQLAHPNTEATRKGLPTERVFVALGSNLGKRQAWLRFALAAFEAEPCLRLVAYSPLLETQAVVLPGQMPAPPYLKAVAELRCTFSPLELLAFLLSLEARAGRKRHKRWEARTLDLDILSFGQRQMRCPRLVVPHPRLYVRTFVLFPWAYIAPWLRLPGEKLTIWELCSRLA